MENLSVIVRQANLDERKSASILEAFNGYFDIATDWESKAKSIVVVDEGQQDLMKQAREGRLFLKSKRVEVENKRKVLKEQSLREGQTIDSIARILKNMIEPIEEYLEQQEKYVEIKDAERKAALEAERIEILKPLNVPYNLYDLKSMSDQDFSDLVNGLKAAIEARRETERREEQDRIEREKKEAAERERVKKENMRLKAEAAEREKQHASERAKMEAERKAAEEKAKAEAAERAKLEAEIKAKAEAEAKAKRDAEIKAQEEERQRILAERRAKRAPDKNKLNELAANIECVKFPDVKSEEAKSILKNVEILLDKVVAYIYENTEKL